MYTKNIYEANSWNLHRKYFMVFENRVKYLFLRIQRKIISISIILLALLSRLSVSFLNDGSFNISLNIQYNYNPIMLIII